MQFGELSGGVIIETTDVLEVVQEFVQMEKRSYKQQGAINIFNIL